MSATILNQFRREAKARGLSWAAVEAAYWEIKQAEREKRERPNEVRQAAWCMATALSRNGLRRSSPSLPTEVGKQAEIGSFRKAYGGGCNPAGPETPANLR